MPRKLLTLTALAAVLAVPAPVALAGDLENGWNRFEANVKRGFFRAKDITKETAENVGNGAKRGWARTKREARELNDGDDDNDGLGFKAPWAKKN